jgi:hypothetical protein
LAEFESALFLKSFFRERHAPGKGLYGCIELRIDHLARDKRPSAGSCVIADNEPNDLCIGKMTLAI